MHPAIGRIWACTDPCRMTCRRSGGASAMHTALLLPSEQGDIVSQFFQIHPENPEPRLINQAVEVIKAGGVIVYATDSSYALGCLVGDKRAVEGIRRLRRLGEKRNFPRVCRDLSEIGVFAKVDTAA